MRKLTFVRPNFLCEIVDKTFVDKYLYCFSSRKELDDYLRARNLNVRTISEYDFDEWEERAKRETANLVQAYERGDAYKFKSAIWSELKQYLFFLSYEKCGYCETVATATSFSDVEHFRPKKKVEEEMGHRGYYWLAYEVTNYIPCCDKCNRARAKMNRFPLSKASVRATDPEDVQLEDPLLINPFIDDPENFLAFVSKGKKFGELRGLNEKGEVSVDVYNLNRWQLIEERKRVYRNLKDRLELAKSNDRVRKRTIDEFRSGESEYSLMVKPVIKAWLQTQRRNTQQRIERERAFQEMLDNDLKILNDH